MHVAVEMSLYPLTGEFIPPILDFIERLKAQPGPFRRHELDEHAGERRLRPRLRRAQGRDPREPRCSASRSARHEGAGWSRLNSRRSPLASCTSCSRSASTAPAGSRAGSARLSTPACSSTPACRCRRRCRSSTSRCPSTAGLPGSRTPRRRRRARWPVTRHLAALAGVGLATAVTAPLAAHYALASAAGRGLARNLGEPGRDLAARAAHRGKLALVDRDRRGPRRAVRKPGTRDDGRAVPGLCIACGCGLRSWRKRRARA